jgi:hypothetical protein
VPGAEIAVIPGPQDVSALYALEGGDCFTPPEAVFKTIQHFVPDFFSALARIPDPRDPTRTIYPLPECYLVGILAYLFKAGSRRNIKYRMGTQKFVGNMQRIGRIFYPNTPFPPTPLHGDTLNNLLNIIPVEYSLNLRKLVLRSLIRSRCLEQWRILGSYGVVMDGTGVVTYYHRHCEHCLTRRLADGRTLYYHPVLEAKLVCPGLGLALSIGTEFIENPGEYVNKQDCELKAFYRLLPKLRKDFPQTPFCLLLDSLYACEGVFRLCDEKRCSYLITFKEGSMPATWQEFQTLKEFAGERRFDVCPDGKKRTINWVNDLAYNEHKLNALELKEIGVDGKEYYSAWLSKLFITRDNAIALARGGRARWIIENEGFNTQKNGGYELEHAFSSGYAAMKHFYIMLQLAHIFDQLLDKGNLLRVKIRRAMGSLRTFSARLWALMTETLIDAERLRAILSRRIQIRFDSS